MNAREAAAESVETIERLGFELLGTIPGATIRGDEGSITIRTGVKVDLCNGVFSVRWGEREAGREIDRRVAEFGATQTPFLIHLTDLSTPKNLPNLLKARGFKPQPAGTMFTLDFDAIPDAGPLPEGLSCARAASGEDIEAFIAIFVEGFRLPPLIAGAFRTFFDNYGFGAEKNYQSLILKDGARPAAIVAILGNRDASGKLGNYRDLPDDLCTMMSLTVAPWARGRWLGLRMAREAVKFARDCGYRRVCTSGTPEGIGIYRRAPLQEVGGCQRWSWHPAGLE